MPRTVVAALAIGVFDAGGHLDLLQHDLRGRLAGGRHRRGPPPAAALTLAGHRGRAVELALRGRGPAHPPPAGQPARGALDPPGHEGRLRRRGGPAPAAAQRQPDLSGLAHRGLRHRRALAAGADRMDGTDLPRAVRARRHRRRHHGGPLLPPRVGLLRRAGGRGARRRPGVAVHRAPGPAHVRAVPGRDHPGLRGHRLVVLPANPTTCPGSSPPRRTGPRCSAGAS